MRDLQRNYKRCYYALYKGKEEILDADGRFTGETRPVYSEPVLMTANYGPATGFAEAQLFGTFTDYSHILSTSGRIMPFDEQTVFWLYIEPNEEADNYNFRISKPAYNLNSQVFAMKAVG